MAQKEATLSSFLQRFVWMLSGNLGYAISQWLLLSVIAKLGNSQDVGTFSIALGVTAPIYMFTNMQLRYIYSADFSGRKFSDYLSSRIIQTGVAFFAVVIIALLLFSDRRYLAFAIIIIGLSKAFESINDIIYGYYQHKRRNDLVSKSLLVRGWISLFIFFLAFLTTKSLNTSLIVYTSSWAVCLLAEYFSFLSVQKESNERFVFLFKRENIIELLKLALPLGVFSGINSLNTTLPRYYIEASFGLSLVGIFSAISYLKIASGYVVDACSNVLLPEFGQLFKERAMDKFFKLLNHIVLAFLCLSFFIILLVIVMGEKILTLIYTAEYAMYVDFFVLITISILLSYLNRIYNMVLTALKFFNFQLTLGLIELVSLNLFLLIFIHKGFIYSAFALIFAESMRLLVSFWHLRKIKTDLK